MRGDIGAHGHILGRPTAGLEYAPFVDARVVDVQYVHQVDFMACHVADFDAGVQQGAVLVKLDKGMRLVFIPERLVVFEHAGDADIVSILIAACDNGGGIIRSGGQFAVQRMRVLRCGAAAAERAAMHEVAPVSLQEQFLVFRSVPVKKCLHDNGPPVKNRIPYLLAVVGQSNDIPPRIRQLDRFHACFILENAGLKLAVFQQDFFFFRKKALLQM